MANSESLLFYPVKGTQAELEELQAKNRLQQGMIYFALDTKKIYYGDYNSITESIDLISMGGNSSIYYGNNKNLSEDSINVTFRDPEDFEDNTTFHNLNINDLILNNINGIFYRVLEKQGIDEDGNQLYNCERLTVAGSGGGGGGTTPSQSIDFTWLSYPSADLKNAPAVLTKGSLYASLKYSAASPRKDLVDSDVKITFVQSASENQSLDNIKQTSKNTLTFDFSEQTTNGFNLTAFVPSTSYSDSTRKIFYWVEIDDGGDSIYTSKPRFFYVKYIAVSSDWRDVLSEKYSTKIINTTNKDNFQFSYTFNSNDLFHYIEFYINEELAFRSPTQPKKNLTAQSFSVTAEELKYSHGFYSTELKIFASPTEDGEYIEVSSDYRGYLFLYDTNSAASIIGCPITSTSCRQYDLVVLPVIIYMQQLLGSGDSTVQVSLLEIGKESGRKSFSNLTWDTFYYNATSAGEDIPIQISISGGTSLIKYFSIEPLDLGMWSEVTDNLLLNFKPKNFSGNEGIWEYEPEPGQGVIQFSENFDIINGGWRFDEKDSERIYFRICAGDSITIPTTLFSQNYVQSTGISFKIIFRVTNCESYDATWGSLKNDAGEDLIKFQAQSTTLSGGSGTQMIRYIEDAIIELELDVAADSASCRDIFGQNLTRGSNKAFSLSWIEGTPYSVIGYGDSHPKLYNRKKSISFGSDECDIDIYLIKGYKASLPFKEHLANFISDSLTSSEMSARLQRNNILTTNRDPDKEILSIDIEQLVDKNRGCQVHEYVIPSIPTAKLKYNDKTTNSLKSGVKDCQYYQYRYAVDENENAFGYKVTDPFLSHPHCNLGVQGTSSLNYIVSAANLDTDFGYDSFVDHDGNTFTGSNSMYLFPGTDNSFVINEGKYSPTDINKEKGKLYNYYKLSESSIGCSYFNTKVNVASAENANNPCLAEWYYKWTPYTSLVCQENDNSNRNQHRDTIEFTNGVLFLVDTNSTLDDSDEKSNNVFNEYNKYIESIQNYNQLDDNEKDLSNIYPQFYAICNMGNSKKNESVFHGKDELCMEIKRNDEYYKGVNYVYFQTPIPTDIIESRNTWSNTKEGEFGDSQFEFRYDPYEKSFTYDGFNKTFYQLSNENLPIPSVFQDLYNTQDKAWSYYTDEEKACWVLKEEVGTHGVTYEWEIYDEFSYWARLVNWFAQNDPNPMRQREGKEKEVLTQTVINALKESSIQDDIDELEQYRLEQKEIYSDKRLDVSANAWCASLMGMDEIQEFSGEYEYDCQERRLAKLLDECEDFISLDSLVYHYLFIEKHSLIDNAAKNTFWSSDASTGYRIWDLSKDYDNDTGSGNDNNGYLTIDYGHENLDTGADQDLDRKIINGNGLPGDPMKNAWVTFIGHLSLLLELGYKDLRKKVDNYTKAGGLSYLDYVDQWQSSIPEICWIADCYRKYLRPAMVYGLGSAFNHYLNKLEGGKKKYQRRQFETYQTAYLDSKYKYASSDDSTVQFRGNVDAYDGKGSVIASITVKPYQKIYLMSGSGQNDYSSVHYERALDLDKEYDLTVMTGESKDPMFNLYGPKTIKQLGSLTDQQKTLSVINASGSGYPVGEFSKLSKLYFNLEPTGALRKDISFSFAEKNILLKEFKAAGLSDGAEKIALSGLDYLTRLQNLDLSGSPYTEIKIADGGLLKSLKLNKIKELTLSSLRYLTQLEFEQLNLALLKIDNIDTQAQNSLKIIQASFQEGNSLPSGIQNFFCTNFYWKLENDSYYNKNIDGDSTISLLQGIYEKYGSDSVTFEVEGKEVTYKLSNQLSGTIELGNWFSDSLLDLYNNYVLNKGLYQIQFIASNQDLNLKTVKIIDTDENMKWSRSFASAITDSSYEAFFSKGVSQYGISAWDEIKTEVVTKDDDTEYTYFFEGWRINEEKINESDFKSKVIEFSQKNNDIILQPVFNKTLKNQIVTIENNGFGVPEKLEIPLYSSYQKILEAITQIPFFLGNEASYENDEMYLWTGLSTSIGGEILSDDFSVNRDITLYATFTDSPVKISDLSTNDNLLKIYVDKEIFIFDESSNGSYITTIKDGFSIGGKVFLYNNPYGLTTYALGNGVNNILKNTADNYNIKYLLFTKDFCDGTSPVNFQFVQYSLQNLRELKYINLNYLVNNPLITKILFNTQSFEQTNLALSSIEGKGKIQIMNLAFSHGLNSDITSLTLSGVTRITGGTRDSAGPFSGVTSIKQLNLNNLELFYQETVSNPMAAFALPNGNSKYWGLNDLEVLVLSYDTTKIKELSTSDIELIFSKIKASDEIEYNSENLINATINLLKQSFGQLTNRSADIEEDGIVSITLSK